MRPSQPTAAQLRCFNEVAAAGGFSAAARRLGVSQPAVTAQVRALEEMFRVQLFARTGRGAALTPLGRRLFDKTARLRDLEQAAADVLNQARALEVGELTIAAGAPGPAMRLIARFRARHPGVRINTIFGNWQEVVTAVQDRAADVGVLTEAPAETPFARTRVLVQKLVALAPQGHPLAAGAGPVSLAALAREPLVFRSGQSLTRRTVDARLAELGLAARPTMELETREAVCEAVAAGLGIGFMFDAASTRADRLARRTVAELPDDYAEHAFCLEGRRGYGPIRAFLDAAEALDDAA